MARKLLRHPTGWGGEGRHELAQVFKIIKNTAPVGAEMGSQMRHDLSAILLGILVAACGASFPIPTQRMADAEAAERGARELGASSTPDAQLHLRLAQEEIAKAKSAVERGENRAADLMLVRAKADAELAISLAREQAADSELDRAIHARQGGVK